MSLKRRIASLSKKFSMPVSYKLLAEGKLFDARNVFDNKGITETRHGVQVYNSTSLGGAVLSVSFFKKANGTAYRIVKVGTAMYSVSATGAHTTIKTGLSSTTKHRAVTTNDRHIIFIESDGLFSYDGTNFTQLGQAAPTGASAAIAAGGSLPNSSVFESYITFYSSTTGFESNGMTINQVTSSSPNLQINLSSIPATAANATIDKVRIYVKNVTTSSSKLYVGEISLGTTTYSITSFPTSTITLPETHAVPLSGGGKYPGVFGKRVVYAGNSNYPNEVYFSEDYMPDAWDDTISATVLEIEGQGPITGLAVGFYDMDYMNPFLAVFKKNSTTIYSELNDQPNQVLLDNSIGCVSHDTIKVRNGVVYFMSTNGWYMIVNGRIMKDNRGLPVSMGNGDVNDIFSRTGWTFELNAGQYSSFFSAVYPVLGHYITWVSEGTSDVFRKAYVYEEALAGFRVYDFKTNFKCACEGEDANGYECVLIGDDAGYLYTHSVRNGRHDTDYAGTSQSIPAYLYLPYVNPDDMEASYNFRQLTLRAIGGTPNISVRAFVGFNLQSPDLFTYSFPESGGFVLDVSALDVDVLGDERVPTTAYADINRTGECLLLGFFQDETDANMGLISGLLTYNKNGRRAL